MKKVIPLLLFSIVLVGETKSSEAPPPPQAHTQSTELKCLKCTAIAGELAGAGYLLKVIFDCTKKLNFLEKLSLHLKKELSQELLESPEAKEFAQQSNSSEILEEIIKNEESAESIQKKRTSYCCYLCGDAALLAFTLFCCNGGKGKKCLCCKILLALFPGLGPIIRDLRKRAKEKSEESLVLETEEGGNRELVTPL